MPTSIPVRVRIVVALARRNTAAPETKARLLQIAQAWRELADEAEPAAAIGRLSAHRGRWRIEPSLCALLSYAHPSARVIAFGLRGRNSRCPQTAAPLSLYLLRFRLVRPSNGNFAPYDSDIRAIGPTGPIGETGIASHRRWPRSCPTAGRNSLRIPIGAASGSLSPDGASWFAVYRRAADKESIADHMKVVLFGDDEAIRYPRGERTWVAVSGFKQSGFHRKAMLACAAGRARTMLLPEYTCPRTEATWTSSSSRQPGLENTNGL